MLTAPLVWRLLEIPDFNAVTYADDVALWACKDNQERPVNCLQRRLDTIVSFQKEVGMTPAPEKTKYTVFGMRRQAAPFQICRGTPPGRSRDQDAKGKLRVRCKSRGDLAQGVLGEMEEGDSTWSEKSLVNLVEQGRRRIGSLSTPPRCPKLRMRREFIRYVEDTS